MDSLENEPRGRLRSLIDWLTGPKPPKLEGSFAFDVMKPRTRCAKVTGALLTRLTRSYSCGPADADTASGVKTVAVCKAKAGDGQFLVFAQAADCENERQTQLANGA